MGNPAVGKNRALEIARRPPASFEISFLPRCRSRLRSGQQNATGAKRCATVRKRCGCFDSVIKVHCPPEPSGRGGLFGTTLLCVFLRRCQRALSAMVGGLRQRRICRQMRRFTPQRAWFHRTYLHRRLHQMRRKFSICRRRRRPRRPVPEPLPLRPSSEWPPPIPRAWFSH